MTSLSRSLPLALLGLLLVPLAGCELLEALTSQTFEVPLDLETPPAELNASDQVDAVEATLCADPDSYNCAVVAALCETDASANCDPPAIPPEFPVSIEITNPTTNQPETVDVEQWVADVGLAQDLDIQQVIPMDLTELVDIEDPDAIEDLTISDVALGWLSNTFTFDTVPLDLYVGPDMADPTAEAADLIADGAVEKVGTVPPQEAEATGDSPIQFVEGGNDKFNAALKTLKFTAVLAFPPGTQIALKEGSAENLRRRPTGDAEVTLKARLLYKVSATKLAEQAEEASGGAQ